MLPVKQLQDDEPLTPHAICTVVILKKSLCRVVAMTTATRTAEQPSLEYKSRFSLPVTVTKATVTGSNRTDSSEPKVKDMRDANDDQELTTADK
jgi:hypothetical protein